MANAGQFSTDELYFGSVPIALSQVSGTSIQYEHAKWKLSYSEKDLSTTLGRANKYFAPGEHDAPPFVIPAIPAREIVATDEAEALQEPALLSCPLIKVPLGHSSALPVKAVASGVRSGLVKGPDGSWYRLKGCGNHYQGFVVRTTPAGSDLEVLDVLGEQGLPCCNEPVAIFQYGPPNDILGPERPLACIVERTRGDRRLGTHVLAGLQLLLPELVHVSRLAEAGSKQGTNGWFPPGRPRQAAGSAGARAEVVSTAELMTDMMLAKEMGVEGHGLSWPDVPRDQTTLAFLGSARLPEQGADFGGDNVQWGGERTRRPSGEAGSGAELPRQWTEVGPRAMDGRWREAFRREEARFREGARAGAARGKSVLGYVHSRLGFDCGRVLRALHGRRISWGTYQDDMCRRDCGEFHCNAHANNLVLLPPGDKPGPMVALLDLDMAFDEESFVDIWGSAGGVAREEFDALLHKEHVNFLEVLAGGDASSGVPMVGQAAMRELPLEARELQAGLLDTLVLGYLRGYSGDDSYPVAELDADLHGAAHAAMAMAVMVMADFVA